MSPLAHLVGGQGWGQGGATAWNALGRYMHMHSVVVFPGTFDAEAEGWCAA